MESVAALAIKVVEKQLLRGAVVRPAQAWPIRLGLGDRSHRARPGASRRRNFRAVWRSRGPAGLRWAAEFLPPKGRLGPRSKSLKSSSPWFTPRVRWSAESRFPAAAYRPR